MERRASDFVEGRYRYRIVTDHVLDGSASDKENNAPCLARTEIFIDQLQRMKECGSSQGFAWLDNISRCWSNDVKVVQHPVRPNGAIFVREIVIGCWCSVGPSVIRENIVQWDVRVSLYHPEAQKLLDMKLDEVKEYISKESLTRIVGHMFSTDDPLEVAKVFYVAQKPSPVQFIPKSYPEIWWNGDYDVKLQVNNADLREAVEECAIRFILQS
ncbi:hypothetical protein B0T17DRAFT_258411 [Bombardia bombarda]|uniref:Uncharacterized protein n=1 Tax=Bombardia bombarda TaxID=252184 RepID=A0AA39X0F5_9PEZI|nr:hypothetical protein B0T17DRAFT_258411 [Bombardia bombarda]